VSEHLEVAQALGVRVATDAVWHQGQCNWVGAWPQESRSGDVEITYRALGPDLYGGTGGIALFLGELAVATGEPRFRSTALGAARQAIARADTIDERQPGLHAGRSGLALALARTGALLAEEELSAAATRVLENLRPRRRATGFDLMSGSAGAIIGLLTLQHLLEDGDGVARAEQFADRLLRTATRRDRHLSWPSEASPAAAHLTGLSHGACGAAQALLELHAMTGTPRWCHAAQGAFAYERDLYDPLARNWPDLRRSGHADHGTPGYASFWCHGAPGIALSRLRAVELLNDAAAREEARIALDTTVAAVRSGLDLHANFSLCHGLAGNAEILLIGQHVLGDERSADAELAAAVAASGRERYLQSGSWPCGTYEGTTPDLFLGLAGIGRFYLRLHAPSLPSLLLVTPRAFGHPQHPPARDNANPLQTHP
jgi:lantibiotic modifying enzyme